MTYFFRDEAERQAAITQERRILRVVGVLAALMYVAVFLWRTYSF